MNLSEYKNIFENEESHFYYRGTNQEILTQVKKYLHDFGLIKPIKILDAGCGTGLLAQKMKSFGEVFGIDIEPNAIKYAKKRKVRIFQSSVEKLPFNKNTFDLITSIDVLYHRRVNEEKALNEFYKVLKPGGLLIIKLPAYNFLRGKHDLFVHTKKRYAKNDVSFIIQKAGFKEIKSTYLASFLFFPALIKRSIERWSGLDDIQVESDLKKPPQIINMILIFLFNIENFILKYINLPFGLSIFSVSKKIKE